MLDQSVKLHALDAYAMIEEREIPELNSIGYILEHRKTKARIFLMSAEDENKVFFAGFRTPPMDSTGVPHIIEHTVLCGSDKFPVKDPFVELVKGSLNTFLNAMTYPDKTVYPIASCNDADFQNLMDVYLDAVLNPGNHKYIYFCASPAFDGTHHFAVSYTEHMKNARAFQRELTARRRAKAAGK